MGKRVERSRARTGRLASLGLLVWAGAFAAVWLCTPPWGEAEEEAPLLPPAQVELARRGREEGRVVKLARQDGRVEELALEDYLWGVVAAEMPASFELEALKAQAVAARTYTMNLRAAAVPRHEGAEICDQASCCQAYVDRAEAEARWGLQAKSCAERITRAVEETRGLVILSDGVPIQAVFFSSAPGRTADAVEVWGNEVSYLHGVDSPEGEEVPNYHTQVSIGADDLRARVLERYPQARLDGDGAGWFQDIQTGPSGLVTSLRLGGAAMSGAEVRTLLGLRSAAFTVDFADGTFLFSVTGYGHGVGMSQYGANALARQGRDFREILAWYYQGTTVQEYEPRVEPD